MEPDLDRLLDFEASGALFPQFADSWASTFEAARECVEQMLLSGDNRQRIAIKTLDSQSFSALFIALCRKPVDVFLFNPLWSKREEDDATEIAQPDWIVGSFVSGEFKRQSSQKTRTDSDAFSEKRMRVMIATGGSSGRIRFAIHDWGTLAGAVYGFQQHMNCEHMASHCVLPLYHVSGFMQLVRALLTMGKIAYGRLDTFDECHAILESVDDKDRFLSLVATQLERLLRVEENHALLRDYRAIFVGGGPVSVGLLEDCRELELPIATTYGMTETVAQVATLQPEKFLSGESNQGKPLPHARIDIVDQKDISRTLERGEIGLIRIAATSLFKGYWGEKLSSNTNSIVTSDLGRIEENGTLSALGRADDVIISGGEKVNLREVEMCIEKTNLVRDAAAFGIKDAEWGEILAVAYVPKEEFVSEAAIQAAIKEELTRYKFPKRWIRLSELPRNEAGKAILHELQALANA